jgi:hypothetical protein
MIQYNYKSQHITKKTSNLPQHGKPIFRCAYALLFYPSNGCVFRQGIQAILYYFSKHYHLLHMRKKLWYLDVPIKQQPTLTHFYVCLSKFSMLRVNAISKVEIPNLWI